jgi:CHAT domain-containing protein/tetratricopeptide (TPR) repeat protein
MVHRSTHRIGTRFRLAKPAARFYIQFIFVCLSSIDVWASVPNTIDRMEPIAGSSVTREIAGNAVQSFEIELQAGLFLELTIQKGDLAMSFRVIGPQNQIVTEETSDRYESLMTSVLTQGSGTFHLEVRSLEQDSSPRSYQLTLHEIRSAKPADLGRGAAAKAFGQGNALRTHWDEASLRNALAKYEEARALWQTVSDFARVAEASEAVADVYFTLGDYRRALSNCELAAAESRRALDKSGEFEALGQQGLLRSYLGDNDTAERDLKRVIDYYRQESTKTPDANIKWHYANSLQHLGEVNYSEGDLNRALHAFQDSLNLFIELADRAGEAQARLFIGYTNATLGEQEISLAEFAKAEALFLAVRNRRGQALCVTAIGSIHSRRGQMQTAIELHREAIQIFREIGDSPSEAITFNSIGQVYQHLDEKDVAIDNYEEALKRFQRNGAVDFATSTIYQIARLYKLMGNNQRALTYYRQCISLSSRAKKRRMEAYALNDIASIYASEGRRTEALKQYQRVLSFYRGIGDRRGEALTLNGMGDLFCSINSYRKALAFYKRAIEPMQKADEEVQIKTLHNVAYAARQTGDLPSALSYVEQAIKKIDEIRTNLAVPDLRTSYTASMHDNYSLYIEILMQQEQRLPGRGFAARALLTSEIARARSLLEVLVESKADVQQGMDPVLTDRARAVQRGLREKELYESALSANASSSTEIEGVAREIRELKTEYQAVEAQLRQTNPRYAALVQPRELDLEELQAELMRDDSMLLEYSLGEEKSYLWAVTFNSLTAYELPPRKQIEDAATETYIALTARQVTGDLVDPRYGERVDAADQQYPLKAWTLSKVLLGPVAQQLASHRLLIVAEGALQYIPFDALPDPSLEPHPTWAPSADQPLLVRHEVVMLPSLSILSMIRREKYDWTPNNVVAVLADPVFSKNDSRLHAASRDAVNAASSESGLPQPRALRRYLDLAGGGDLRRLSHTSDEADAIVAAAPRGTSIIAKGFEANRETAMSSQFGKYQILHFATHGLLDSEHPELSSIVLSRVDKNGQSQDGLMQLQDIYNLKVSSNLVVLSACNTALGKNIQGEGLISLTRGFMYAGSRSVVATLWSVDDKATTELMSHFYEALLKQGLPPGAALRAAKLALREEKRWRPPYFWAAFVLQGEYREPVKIEPRSRYGFVYLLTPILIVTALGFYLVVIRRLRRRR